MRQSNSQNNAPLPFGPRHNFGGEKQKVANKKGTIRRIASYMSEQKLALILVGVLVVFATGSGLLGPILMGRAIDQYIAKHDLPGLVGICSLMLASYVFAAALTWMQGYVMVGVATKTIYKIRSDLFHKLQQLPVGFFDSRSHGDLMSRLTNDVERLSSLLTDSFAQMVSSLLNLVGIFVAMLFLSPTLTLVTVGSLAGISLFFNKVIVKRIGVGFRAQQQSLGELNGIVQESISGQRVIKAYAQESSWLSRFDKANNELRAASTHAQTFAGTIGPMMNGGNNLSLALIVGTGGWLVVQGFSTVGTIAAFINYARQFGRPLNDLANLFSNVESALAGAERVFETIDEQPEPDALATTDDVDFSGDIVFENVTFSYTQGTPILKQINLHAKPGETVALIGPTGAGKTTIVNLLTRFYEIDSGKVMIDGTDLKQIPKRVLRRKLGIVLQDNFLFVGTVRENIRYGRLTATNAEVVEAAKMANVDEFLRHLPHGYDTMLTERGSNLSQGQRQLLSIARTLLADPQILILDEATSSVDTRTERNIQEAMLRLMKGRTCFVIAHRLNTIRTANQILVLQNGEITEHGSHEELMARRGFYFSLLSGSTESIDDAVGAND